MTSAESPAGGPGRPVVTLASFHGTNGRFVGPRVAERLGVSFLDRGIAAGDAERMLVPELAVEQLDADIEKQPRGVLRRYFDSLGNAAIADSTPGSDVGGRYRAETEEFLARAVRHGGVVLGRGGMVVLRGLPGVLHVLLTGPVDARVRRIMELDGVDRAEAQRRVAANDRVRVGYVRNAYGVDPGNSALYHLQIDGTVFDVDTCVELIVTAAHARHAGAMGSDD
jgi:hypothetical protein